MTEEREARTWQPGEKYCDGCGFTLEGRNTRAKYCLDCNKARATACMKRNTAKKKTQKLLT